MKEVDMHRIVFSRVVELMGSLSLPRDVSRDSLALGLFFTLDQGSDVSHLTPWSSPLDDLHMYACIL